MNTKYYPNRVLLISNPSPTHELYRIKMMEIKTKISHGLLNSLVCKINSIVFAFDIWGLLNIKSFHASTSNQDSFQA